jgi:hypothetical protein
MSGSDGRSAGNQQAGDHASPGVIPPSFGASSPPPAIPALASAQPTAASQPTLTGPVPRPPAAPAPPPAAPAPPPQPDPGLDDGPTVGWYPTAPTGQPAAGPFAASSASARRGLSMSRFTKPSGAGRTPAWSHGRGVLTNVLLFGFAPLALAGLVVAAFVLVTPGKGAASSVSFQAGPAHSAQPSTATFSASPSPSPSAAPSAHKKRHPGATSTTLPSKGPGVIPSKAKPKATPKPTHRSGGRGVVPHDLGQPNFNGYCQHIGHGSAEVLASNAYGWHCTLPSGPEIKTLNACAWTYHLSTSQVIDVSTDYYDPNAWQCWRINRDLGVLNFTTYCTDAGLGTSKLVADNAYGWQCTASPAAIDTNAACDTVYRVSDAVSRFAVFASPYFWQCWN